MQAGIKPMLTPMTDSRIANIADMTKNGRIGTIITFAIINDRGRTLKYNIDIKQVPNCAAIETAKSSEIFFFHENRPPMVMELARITMVATER